MTAFFAGFCILIIGVLVLVALVWLWETKILHVLFSIAFVVFCLVASVMAMHDLGQFVLASIEYGH